MEATQNDLDLGSAQLVPVLRGIMPNRPQPELRISNEHTGTECIRGKYKAGIQRSVYKNSIRQTLDSLVLLRMALASTSKEKTKRPRDPLARAMFSVKRVSAEVIEWN
jgi:hypothetical protein